MDACISVCVCVNIISQKRLQLRLESKIPGVICKLDIEKAYDNVNWEVLLKLLKKMGFGEKWCSWIRTCISTVQFFVLVNGSPADFFGNSRGLRQGDPLSPLLFLVMMEVFSRMVKRMEGAGLLSGFKHMVGGVEGDAFPTCCLQMILFCFVMQRWSKSFMFDCCFLVFRL